MATVHGSGRLYTKEGAACIWGECDAPASTMLDLAVCDRHAIKAYRAVAELLRESPKAMGALAELLAGAQPERVLGKPRPRTDPTRRNVRTTPGTVYFFRMGDLVKIGYTTDLPRRRRALVPDEVLATTPGTMGDEKALHHRFGHAWSHGEYFRPEPELLAHIETLRRVA